MAEHQSQTWIVERYERNAPYVSGFARPVLKMLEPRPGQRILDLGCGEGRVTEELVAAGADVVGVDASAEMIAQAKARGLDARLANACELDFSREFDVVFSNSVLHWIREPERVIDSVARALKPGGRFVGEFGGHGCCGAGVVAIAAVLARRGIDIGQVNPWYYPTAREYRLRLEAGGFAVDYAELVPLPTPLPTGMMGFLETFCEAFFRPLPASDRRAAMDEVVKLVGHAMCDHQGHWTMDFVRVRFAAHMRT